MSNSKGSGARCSVCGFRIRGSNHNEGHHHKNYTNKEKVGKIIGR